VRLSAKVWRHIPAGAHPRDLEAILRSGGRWNRPDVYGCLYTALTLDGAIAELRKAKYRKTGAPREIGPRDLVSIHVDLDPVVDLTDPANPYVDPKEPLLTGNTDADKEHCRSLADRVRADGVVGIIVPSAAAAGEKNLAIYIDGPAGGIHLTDGGDRIPDDQV
jgi:RES domain-containing protein